MLATWPIIALHKVDVFCLLTDTVKISFSCRVLQSITKLTFEERFPTFSAQEHRAANKQICFWPSADILCGIAAVRSTFHRLSGELAHRSLLQCSQQFRYIFCIFFLSFRVRSPYRTDRRTDSLTDVRTRPVMRRNRRAA